MGILGINLTGAPHRTLRTQKAEPEQTFNRSAAKAATKSRFSGFWSPMPRSERDSEDSTGVLKSDLAPQRFTLQKQREQLLLFLVYRRQRPKAAVVARNDRSSGVFVLSLRSPHGKCL